MDILKIKSYEITLSNLINSGVTTDSILINISQYVLIILIVIILIFIIWLFSLIPIINQKVKNLFAIIL